MGAVVCAAVLAGVAAVRLRRLLAETGWLRGAAVICGATSLVAGALCRVGWTGVGDRGATAVGTEVARCLVLDGSMVSLTVWLLRQMPPTAFSSRYLLVPLVTVVEGFLLLRPGGSWTLVAGLGLMAGGSAWLLMDDSDEVQSEF